ncbi:YggT family protein [Heliophilum fasciatum]|uniref:YggT family protein n=1 Tax=Heliophilum fasciatum TaxID=35700 RepID=A0A4R2RH59_9FIRM|nr:YggT family protein [Heliophilum fasciatum]MCW2278884.1 YggT family protein [Heliophilum fasciatum]TCP62104.1 YggT family protein [Heliophilum fasciatum]
MSLYQIVSVVFTVMEYLIFARVLISYFPHNPNGAIFGFIYEVTEPLLGPVRRMMPASSMPFDFSPMVALLLLYVVERVVLQLL